MVYFPTKIPIWLNFGRPYVVGIFMAILSILRTYGMYTYLTAIWCILRSFGIFFQFRYVVPRKIWQPCHRTVSGIVLLNRSACFCAQSIEILGATPEEAGLKKGETFSPYFVK
jgi:hypothetical protein